MSNPLFILGAGFNRDARGEIGVIKGRSIFIGEHEIKTDYPLASDLLDICFNDVDTGGQVSIEVLFENSIAKDNYEPLNKLYYLIMEADHYLIPELLPNNNSINSYSTFFDTFKNSSFLTFNYDSLIDLFLLHYKTWNPLDGYGVQVEAEIDNPTTDVNLQEASTSFVLHLHGSLCIYSVDINLTTEEGRPYNLITPKKNSDFIFDAEKNANLFHPYLSVPPRIGGYEPVEKRVIAPIPNKAEGLKGEFIKGVYSKAKSLLGNAETLVSVGYSYNPLDESSYEELINTFSSKPGRKVLLIGPDAVALSSRLKESFNDLEWIPIEMTFKEWVENRFEGLGT